MAIQNYYRGVRDLKIATWTSAATYGTEYDVLGVRSMGLTWQVESDELRGDDVVLDRYTKLVSVQVTLEQAALDLTVIDMILGGTLVSNASYYDLMVDEDDEVPYIAIAGRVVGSGGTSDQHFFIPKAKLSGDLNLTAQVDTYLLPSATFQGVNEGTANGMLRMRTFSALTDLEIPLRTTTGTS